MSSIEERLGTLLDEIRQFSEAHNEPDDIYESIYRNISIAYRHRAYKTNAGKESTFWWDIYCNKSRTRVGTIDDSKPVIFKPSYDDLLEGEGLGAGGLNTELVHALSALMGLLEKDYVKLCHDCYSKLLYDCSDEKRILFEESSNQCTFTVCHKGLFYSKKGSQQSRLRY